MVELIVGLSLLVLVLLAAAIVVRAVVASTKLARDEWIAAADHLGVNYLSGRRSHEHGLSGRVNDLAVRVDVVTDNEKQRAIQYSVQYPSRVASPVVMTRQGRVHVSIVKKVLGYTDVTIGDKTFDSRVLINADANVAATFLTPIRRQAVLHLFAESAFSDVEVTDAEITVQTSGSDASTQKLVNIVASIVATATTMIANDDVVFVPKDRPPAPMDSMAPPAYLDIQMPVQDAVIEPAAAPPPPSYVPPVYIPPATYVPPPTYVPPAPIPSPAAPLPEINEPVAAAEPATPEVATEPQFDSGVSLHQLDVIADLFDSTRMGFDTDNHFAATYAGQHIEWTGTVDTVRDIRHDADFGSSGVKVTLFIGVVGSSQMRSGRVHAVLGVPEKGSFKSGAEVTFTGVLLRVDRFTKNIYVKDATPRS